MTCRTTEDSAIRRIQPPEPWPVAVVVLGLLCHTGCHELDQTGQAGRASPPATRHRVPEPAPAEHRSPGRVVIGKSVQGRPIVCEVHGRGDDVVLIMATIHGNEPAGTPLVRHLGGYLDQHPQLLAGRRVLLIPVANPDGMAHRTRHNANGIDLNRNFPASSFAPGRRHGKAPLSEPESRAIYQLLEADKPDRVVSIHQPMACIDYDGPARGLAEAMAASCDLPVRRIGSRPGSLGSHVGLTRRIAIITLELPPSANRLTEQARWERYRRALLVAVTWPHAVPDEPVAVAKRKPKRGGTLTCRQ